VLPELPSAALAAAVVEASVKMTAAGQQADAHLLASTLQLVGCSVLVQQFASGHLVAAASLGLLLLYRAVFCVGLFSIRAAVSLMMSVPGAALDVAQSSASPALAFPAAAYLPSVAAVLAGQQEAEPSPGSPAQVLFQRSWVGGFAHLSSHTSHYQEPLQLQLGDKVHSRPGQFERPE
jgi:hypothetical protein